MYHRSKSRITQLENRKSKLENKKKKQTTQVVTFFQQLHNQLEDRKEILLGGLSEMYHTLMTSLENGLQQLKQIVTYAGYLNVLNMYSYVANISHKPRDKLHDISLFVTDYYIHQIHSLLISFN
ncbi:hypothetical protein LOD99_14263 [Oopsacas minuta]|uniref:Uncharacterized protein n=1 Tax=Oopsacas minuta TaxID=111878 RepID=A0AAV7KF70_9METZ|nr:hypothetical protein LOD99_14263 [Oopsacas minuta]